MGKFEITCDLQVRLRYLERPFLDSAATTRYLHTSPPLMALVDAASPSLSASWLSLPLQIGSQTPDQYYGPCLFISHTLLLQVHYPKAEPQYMTFFQSNQRYYTVKNRDSSYDDDCCWGEQEIKHAFIQWEFVSFNQRKGHVSVCFFLTVNNMFRLC